VCVDLFVHACVCVGVFVYICVVCVCVWTDPLGFSEIQKVFLLCHKKHLCLFCCIDVWVVRWVSGWVGVHRHVRVCECICVY